MYKDAAWCLAHGADVTLVGATERIRASVRRPAVADFAVANELSTDLARTPVCAIRAGRK